MKLPSRPWSLRKRLSARVLRLVVGGWLLTNFLSAVVLEHEMNEMFDEELQALVETTVLFLDGAPGRQIPRLQGVETRDGERVLRILPPTGLSQPAPWPDLAEDGFHDSPGWRVLRRSAEGMVIEAAHSTSWRREEMFEAASAFLVLALPLIGLLLWGLGRTVREATAPVADLAATVGNRKPDDLAPIGASGLPDELVPLAQSFDDYLGRIGALRQSERDFVANAAHELRTPLAALRNRLQLSSDPDAQAAVQTVDNLTHRVERLLQLARLEAGIALGRGPTDLVRILRLLMDELRPTARVPLRFDDGDMLTLPVLADPDALAILLRNLIENAVEHGSGVVTLRLTPGGVLTIDNPAKGASLPKTRFTRGAASTGMGLGLSIAEALSKAMDVPMRLDPTPDRMRCVLQFTPSPRGAVDPDITA